MNEANCQCKPKNYFLENQRVSIYPFLLTMAIGFICASVGFKILIDNNVSVVNLYFGVGGGALCIFLASISRYFDDGKARNFFVKILLFLSNVATDIGFGSAGFYVGSELVYSGLVMNTYMWILGAFALWLALNYLYKSALTENLTPEFRKIFVKVTIGIAVGFILWFYIVLIMR